MISNQIEIEEKVEQISDLTYELGQAKTVEEEMEYKNCSRHDAVMHLRYLWRDISGSSCTSRSSEVIKAEISKAHDELAVLEGRA